MLSKVETSDGGNGGNGGGGDGDNNYFLERRRLVASYLSSKKGLQEFKSFFQSDLRRLTIFQD